MKRYVFAITGASGSAIGLRALIEVLKSAEVHLIISANGLKVLMHETGADWSASTTSAMQKKVRKYLGSDRVTLHPEDELAAPVSSGSFQTDGMLVVPCSMKTLSGIANGYASTLVERAADVTIKEGRRLVLCPRETPLSAVHLENMLKLARLGVRIVPPIAGFYHKPETIDEMIDFLAGKVLDAMGFEHSIYPRWGVQD